MTAEAAGDWVIVMWLMSDGRLLPFNHPEARAERLAAVAKHFGPGNYGP